MHISPIFLYTSYITYQESYMRKSVCFLLITALTCLLIGCGAEKKIDSFVRGVVVEKTSNTTTSIVWTPYVPVPDTVVSVTHYLKVMHLPDALITDTMLFTFEVRQDAEKSRPLGLLLKRITVGTQIAFAFRDLTGSLFKVDNIGVITTKDFAILDRPGELQELADLATREQKQKLLDEAREVEALRKFHKQFVEPKE